MGISISNNGGTNTIVINGSNNIVVKNEGEQNVSVNGNNNHIAVKDNISENFQDNMLGFNVILGIFFSFLFILTCVFIYNILKSGNLSIEGCEDLFIKEEEENIFEKRKKELFFLINERFHSKQIISRIENNLLNLEDKYSKNLLKLKSVEFKRDYVEQIHKENEEIISLVEKFINEITIHKSNFEEAEDLEKILMIFKN